MTAKFVKLVTLAAVVVLSASCGDVVRDGRSPVLLVVKQFQAASGADEKFGGTLLSDVITMVTKPAPCSASAPCASVFNDSGEVILSLQLKDPGSLGVAASPSLTNTVTINRYRVEYLRTDGRNTPGVDVPYGFDSAVTSTVPSDGDVKIGFNLVRHAAKEEAPLRALADSGQFISVIATVTFYGQDQAGNEVSVASRIGIDFGNFADPQ